MIKAFVLGNIAPGKELSTLDELKQLNNIQSVSLLYGSHDFALQLSVKNLNELKSSVLSDIRKVNGITKTNTHLVLKEGGVK